VRYIELVAMPCAKGPQMPFDDDPAVVGFGVGMLVRVEASQQHWTVAAACDKVASNSSHARMAAHGQAGTPFAVDLLAELAEEALQSTEIPSLS
jgi:hypothetical protein